MVRTGRPGIDEGRSTNPTAMSQGSFDEGQRQRLARREADESYNIENVSYSTRGECFEARSDALCWASALTSAGVQQLISKTHDGNGK